MVNRRNFLVTASVAGVAACAPRDERAEAQQAPADKKLPPAIAALQSMKAQAKPITVEERQARIAKATRLMGEKKLDAVLLAGGTSLSYFTNVSWGNSERMLAVVLPVKGTPFVVCPAFEEARAREQIEKGPLGKDVEVRVWQEDESPYQRVAEGLKARGISTGRLGIEETVKFVFADEIAAAAPALKLVSGTPVTAGCRAVKDAHEIELMRLANVVTLKAYEAAYKSLKEGMTQADVRELISQAHEQLGFTGSAGVTVGQAAANPHGSTVKQTVQQGTILLADGGGTVEGYKSDISRTFVLGKPTDKMKQVFDIVLKAQTAALKAAKPGVEAQAIDAAARTVIVDAGYGPGFKYFAHRVGHGIGMDGHEWPYLVPRNILKVEAGMTFSDEPGIYIPGEFGVRLEDILLITAQGAELLTPQSPSLEHPFDLPTA